MSNTSYHNDEPVLQDGLDRKHLIKEVGEAIANCSPPQVFGVHGDWGLGKTSFLHQVQWFLTGDCPQQPEAVLKEAKANGAKAGNYVNTVQAVWFDAWRYQHEDAPIVALLHEIRAQLSWGKRAARVATRNTKVAVRGALLSIENITRKIGFQYSKFEQVQREARADDLATTLPSHTLREHLRVAIDQLLPPKRASTNPSPKLVVFIDDVDRCEPEAAYRLLEGLKIYLTLHNCVFVLGMNQKAIEEAIAQRMRAETDDETRLRAVAYMEKLCQNVWRLPAVRSPVDVLDALLKKTIANPTQREWIVNGAKAAEPPIWLPRNPRRLKGFANLIGRLSAQLPEEDTNLETREAIHEAQHLLIVAYIYQFHHDLYIRWEADPTLYAEIWEWCRRAFETVDGSEDAVELQRSREEHSFLKSLTLPLKSSDPELAEPTPGRFESAFPDPTQANVFWVQALVLHLGQEADSRRFNRYLHVSGV